MSRINPIIYIGELGDDVKLNLNYKLILFDQTFFSRFLNLTLRDRFVYYLTNSNPAVIMAIQDITTYHGRVHA